MQTAIITDEEGNRILVQRDIYIYQAQFLALIPEQDSTITIDIEADSSFVWLKTTYLVNNNVGDLTQETVPVPDLTVQITDTGSGRNLQQAPVQIETMAGTGRLPFILPIPRTFKPKSTIQVTMTNDQPNGGDTYNGISLVMHGYKQWKLKNLGRA